MPEWLSACGSHKPVCHMGIQLCVCLCVCTHMCVYVCSPSLFETPKKIMSLTKRVPEIHPVTRAHGDKQKTLSLNSPGPQMGQAFDLCSEKSKLCHEDRTRNPELSSGPPSLPPSLPLSSGGIITLPPRWFLNPVLPPFLLP